MHLEHGFLFSTFFICLTNSNEANKRKGLPVFKLPYFSGAHVSKPVDSILWQSSRTFIFTGSYYNVSIRDPRWDKVIKFIWWFVCVKYFGIFYNSSLWINNNNMQASIMTFFIFFNLYQLSIYRYFSKVSSIEARWHCLNYIMILS